jgi:16S rRNA (cytosine1402-N4)-methyltransferase
MHRSVLLNEVVDGLLGPEAAGHKNLVVVDATFGGGGHAREILKKFPQAKIIALDQDASTIRNKGEDERIIFHNENFRNLDKVLWDEGVAEVQGIIFDLGLSSDQLESSGRGFSFRRNEPLLMTMEENPSEGEVTAGEVVNTWSEDSLAKIIAGYGEERFAKRIARGLVEAREKKKIETTQELVNVIERSVPAAYRRGKLHFATRTFQALRIAVNDELGALAEGLEKGFEALGSGGRLAVITFHSLEDRLVKRFCKAKEEAGEGKRVNKRVIRPSEAEIRANPRSRSAKLRIFKKG